MESTGLLGVSRRVQRVADAATEGVEESGGRLTPPQWVVIQTLEICSACAPDVPALNRSFEQLNHQREADLIQNAVEFARTIAQYVSKPATNFLHGVALKYWKQRLSKAAQFKHKYHSDPSFRQKQIDRCKLKQTTADGRKTKQFSNALAGAKRNHWWPLYNALDEARTKSGGGKHIDVSEVYKSLGLVYGKKKHLSIRYCDWQPRKVRQKMSEQERLIKQRNWNKANWQRIKQDPSRLAVYRAKEQRKRERRKASPHWICRMTVARRICAAMRRNSTRKSARSNELLGCTYAELAAHLEQQFKRGMSWDNFGSYWHIDHIIPCAAFDLSKPEQQRQCFHYLNLQPLEAKANMSKGAKIIPAQIPLGVPTRRLTGFPRKYSHLRVFALNKIAITD